MSGCINLSSLSSPSTSAVEQFIRSKYEKKLYMDKGASTSGKAPPTTSSSKSARPAQQENRLKVKKTHERKSTPPKNEVNLLTYNMLYSIVSYVYYNKLPQK